MLAPAAARSGGKAVSVAARSLTSRCSVAQLSSKAQKSIRWSKEKSAFLASVRRTVGSTEATFQPQTPNKHGCNRRSTGPGSDETGGHFFYGFMLGAPWGLYGVSTHSSSSSSDERGDCGVPEEIHSRKGRVVACQSAINQEARTKADVGSSGPRSNDAEKYFLELNELSDLQVFAGTSHPQLAKEICAHLGISPGRAYLGSFADGETSLEILDEVRGKDVFILQSVDLNSGQSSRRRGPHEAIMELLFMVSALRRASAKRITAVLPYMAYFRHLQSSDFSSNDAKPLGGAVIEHLLCAMGVDRVVFVDCHSRNCEGFPPESIPITNVNPQSLAIEYFRRKMQQENLQSLTVVATDNTGVEKAEAFFSRLQHNGIEADLVTMLSSRPERESVEGAPRLIPQKVFFQDTPPPTGLPTAAHQVKEDVPLSSTGDASHAKLIRSTDWLVGDVSGRDCVIVDDIIDTGERAVNTARALKAAGAHNIYMYATHGLFSKGCRDRLMQSPIKEVVVTDSVPIPSSEEFEKLHVISISKLLAEIVRRIHDNTGLSTLHRDATFDQILSTEERKQ